MHDSRERVSMCAEHYRRVIFHWAAPLWVQLRDVKVQRGAAAACFSPSPEEQVQIILS